MDKSRWEKWLIPEYLASLGLDDNGQSNAYRKKIWPSIITNNIERFTSTVSSISEFTFPISFMNNPNRQDRRKHMEILLPSLGFTNSSFPPGIAAEDLDITSLVISGSIRPDAVAHIE